MNFYEYELPGQSKTAVVSQESSRDIRKQAKRGTACMHACMDAHLSPQHLRQNRGVKASLGYIASPGLKTDGKPRSEKSASI